MELAFPACQHQAEQYFPNASQISLHKGNKISLTIL